MEDVNMNGPAPFVRCPVRLKDYEKAVIQMVNEEPIEHPDITVAPVNPQQILTLGLIKKFIQQFIPATGYALKNLDYDVLRYDESRVSHELKKIKTLFGIDMVLA